MNNIHFIEFNTLQQNWRVESGPISRSWFKISGNICYKHQLFISSSLCQEFWLLMLRSRIQYIIILKKISSLIMIKLCVGSEPLLKTNKQNKHETVLEHFQVAILASHLDRLPKI